MITKEHKNILVKAVSIAKTNGYEIDDSFFTEVEVEDQLFDGMKRYYNVIFDHGFARCLWTSDMCMDIGIEREELDHDLPREVDLVETLKAGNHPLAALIMSITCLRIPIWQYNLAQMVLSEDPLMYIKSTFPEVI